MLHFLAHRKATRPHSNSIACCMPAATKGRDVQQVDAIAKLVPDSANRTALELHACPVAGTGCSVAVHAPRLIHDGLNIALRPRVQLRLVHCRVGQIHIFYGHRYAHRASILCSGQGKEKRLEVVMPILPEIVHKPHK